MCDLIVVTVSHALGVRSVGYAAHAQHPRRVYTHGTADPQVANHVLQGCLYSKSLSATVERKRTVSFALHCMHEHNRSIRVQSSVR